METDFMQHLELFLVLKIHLNVIVSNLDTDSKLLVTTLLKWCSLKYN